MEPGTSAAFFPIGRRRDSVEGVVITFFDSSERRRTADTLEAANRHAQLATIAKSRFLAAASHDLRQPLQTLVLIQGSLEKAVKGEKAQRLVARLDETVGVMSGMLNTLLDINQIDSGVVSAEMFQFPVNDLLLRLKEEFTYQAQAQACPVSFHVVPCSLSIESDPRLLEQMIRNILSNALKYTKSGRVLLGCRRRGEKLNIEIWDTGAGIPESELEPIFDEYHQLDNSARERSRGLGLGLSIVRRLGKLLNHRVSVRSQLGKGSVFAIEVAVHSGGEVTNVSDVSVGRRTSAIDGVGRGAEIMIVEDDPEVRDLLETLLKDEGYGAITAPDGIAALRLVTDGLAQPQIILADYNLPNGMDGLQMTAQIRKHLHRDIPVIVLTGDISTGTLRDIALQNCTCLNKPVRLTELTLVIQRLLAAPQSAAPLPSPERLEEAAASDVPMIFVVDDDRHVREAVHSVLEDDGHAVRSYASGEAFLAAYRPGREACLLVDAYLPGISGLELLKRFAGGRPSLADDHDHWPQRCFDGRARHERGCHRLHREACQPQGSHCGRRTRPRTIERFRKVVGVAGGGGKPPRGVDASPAANHGDDPRRPSQQEHCRRSRHQPTHGRESPRRDHAEDRLEVVAGACAAGGRRRCGRRRSSRDGLSLSNAAQRFRCAARRCCRRLGELQNPARRKEPQEDQQHDGADRRGRNHADNSDADVDAQLRQ